MTFDKKMEKQIGGVGVPSICGYIEERGILFDQDRKQRSTQTAGIEQKKW